jgi:hypothetical protein
MTKNTKIVLSFLIIILLLAGGYFFSKKNETVNIVVDNNPAPQISSIKGCYVAHLSKDVYVLDIESQTDGSVTGMLAYNNYQKDSSSGSFTGTYDGSILLGNYSFDSEGMHSDRQVIFKKADNGFIQGFGAVTTIGNKEVFTDPQAVTYDPKSTFVASENCTENFVGSNISFDYSSFFAENDGTAAPMTEWRLNAVEKGILVATVTAPRTYMPKTNFSEAKLTIGRSSDTNAIKSCTEKSAQEQQQGTVTIGNYQFYKFVAGDAAAGNLYETTSYRGIVDGDCYAIEYTIHSTNIGNYSPDQGIKEFDKAKIQSEMEKIVKSFKSFVNSD